MGKLAVKHQATKYVGIAPTLQTSIWSKHGSNLSWATSFFLN